MFVGLREKAGELAFRRGSEFPYRNDEADLAGSMRFFERELVKHRQLFGSVFLSKFPITHHALRRRIATCPWLVTPFFLGPANSHHAHQGFLDMHEFALALVFFLGAVGKRFLQKNQIAAEFKLGENQAA